MVIWLIGLSGSGKTTIGREVCILWKDIAPNTVLVDGDDIRKLLNDEDTEKSYSLSARRQNAERIFRLCKWLDSQGMNVVCCILSIFPDLRQNNREQFSRYFEVLVDAPLSTLAKRDEKDLYKRALRGEISNVVGVDIEFPRPERMDMTIDNSMFQTDPIDIARNILIAAGVMS